MYPIFLKLNNRKTIVVGGGAVAERKVRALVLAGSQVTLISPEVSPGLRDMIEMSDVVWIDRSYEEGDLEGFLLAIAATDQPQVNERVFAEAMSRNMLVNSVDDPKRCNFYVPAVVHRDPLQIAISSSGVAPYFAKRLREYLETKLYQGIGAETEQLGRLRANVLSTGEGQGERAERVRDAQRSSVDRILQRIDEA